MEYVSLVRSVTTNTVYALDNLVVPWQEIEEGLRNRKYAFHNDCVVDRTTGLVLAKCETPDDVWEADVQFSVLVDHDEDEYERDLIFRAGRAYHRWKGLDAPPPDGDRSFVDADGTIVLANEDGVLAKYAERPGRLRRLWPVARNGLQ